MNKLKMDPEKSNIFETTPDLFTSWLRIELARKWDDGNIIQLLEAVYFPRKGLVSIPVQAGAPYTLHDEYHLLVRHDTIGLFDLGDAIQFEVEKLLPNETRITAGCKDLPDFPGLKERFESLWTKILQTFEVRKKEKARGKRETTLDKELKVTKAYKAMQRRNKKEFREALRSEDVKQRKVTAKDIFELHGAEFGLGLRAIQKIIRKHKEKEE